MLVTPLYAAIFGLVFIALSVRTLWLRRKLGVALGDRDKPILMKATRAHANFAEYVPISLLLVFFLETRTDAALWVHVLCITLLIFAPGLANDVVYEESSEMAPVMGREAFKEYATAWINCSSNRQLRPMHKLSSGSEMVVELHYEGTHDQGEMCGVKATGKQMYFDAALWLQFDDGRIRRLKAFYNPFQLMQQIGAA